MLNSSTNMRPRLAVALLFFASLPFLLSAQTAGTLDNSFGTSGAALTAIGTGNDFANAVAVQSDGKIVASGYSITGTKYVFSLARYNTDGTLDNTFGTAGKISTSIQTATDQIYAMVIQPDGKIVVGGVSSSTANSYDWALARYNTNGTLDNTFGTNGIVISSLSTKQDYLYKVLLQNDGKIIGVGYSNDGTRSNFTIARYNANGTLDTSFGTNGVASYFFDPNSSIARSAVLLSDGKIIIGGSVTNATVSPSVTSFALIKYNSNGTLDSSFGTGGKVITPVGTSSDIIYSMVLMPDGKIVAGGTSRVGTLNNFAVARYNSNGTLDTSFGTNGFIVHPFGTATASFGALLYVPSVGLLAGGYGTFNTVISFGLVLYSSTDGKLVNTFGTSGVASTAVGMAASGISALALQKDNKLIAAGYAQPTGGTNYDFALARYFTGATVDVKESRNNIPFGFKLSQNYPNPFNPTTKIQFTIKNAGFTTLKVFDALGREISTLFSGYAEAGRLNEVTFDAKNLSSGMYFAQLKSNNQIQIRKMILVK